MADVVLYDVARLIDRLNAPTPTGIDRIDLAYLLHFMARPGARVIGVAIRRGRMVALPDRYLRQLADLARRTWLGGQPVGSATKSARLRMRIWLALQRRIIGVVDAQIRGLKGPITYVNAGHSHHSGAAAFDVLKGQLGGRVVIYIHDLIPIDYPEFARPGHKARHQALMALTAQVATLVLTNSDHTQHRFATFFRSHGVAPPDLTTLPPGLEQVFLASRDPTPESAETYFVAVGTLEPRKNLSMLLRIWTDARAEGAPLPALRLIGQRGWVTRANADTDRLLSRLRPDVVHLPGLADAALIEQVSGARALLLPTQAEGWGLPLAEACALGVPAVASDLPALREAAQGRAKFLAPDDPEIWATAIRHYIAPASPRHAAAVSALLDYRPPTWKAYFQKLDALLRK